ncbi:glycoside hydrolase family 2 protein [Microbacterium sp. NPDC055903]
MAVIELSENWTVTAVSGPAPDGVAGVAIPARVPGAVHLDLHREGLIAEPFDGANETDQQWIGDVDWSFTTSFEWHEDGSERRDLVADGLDTIATVTLNGVEVGRTQNQHRSYRFDVGAALVDGRNELRIDFAAPVPAALARSEEHDPRPHTNHHAYNALRKMASSFGWDWGIDVAASGIWKPIRLETWSGVRIASVRPLVDVDGTTGILNAHVAIERADGLKAGPVTVQVEVDGRVGAVEIPAHETAASVRVEVPDAQLWWPRSHGAQPLYDVAVSVGQGGGSTIDSWAGRVGFRTIRVDIAPDEHGSPYAVHVNGRLVQIRGANWIPDHAFTTEVDRDRYARRIADATEANMNLLRVWGGGIYEADDFYEICDEQGVLVQQDFLFACAAYAEEEWLAVEVEAEAREAITRLSGHPSLAIWNGNNENIVGYTDWGWRPRLGGKTWGEGYYRRLFPRLLAELDPTRFYSAGSPYSFSSYVSPNLDTHGTVHIWDVWNQKDYTAYTEWNPRFVAEFGFQGPPAWTTLVGAVHDSPLEPYGEQMLVHQKAHEGNLKLERGYLPHLPKPATIDDWHWATQLNQAAAVRFGISHFRSLAPYNTGSIVWQLNDDWPVISWAAVDFEERRKPLWYALKAVYEPRFITVQPRDGVLAAVLLNDHDEPWAGEVAVRRLAFDGTVLAEASIAADLPARGEQTLALPEGLRAAADASGEVLVVDAPGFARTIHDFAEVVDQRLDRAPFTTGATRVGADIHVRISASAYVRDAFVLADRGHADAAVDSGLVSLLPGEEHVFVVTGAPADVDPSAFLGALVLRHAGDLQA